jgi:FKBP-type peptidyl-prolyl cis-trans isomerase SlyD
MQIDDRAVVTFHYTLTDDSGRVIDSSAGQEPLTYLQGSGQIVPGLERQMAGHSAGDTFEAVVSPGDGYGESDPALMQVISRAQLQGVDDLQVGMQFQAEGGSHPTTVTISKIDGDQVTVDANHPLAGATLHFAIEVTGVREASAEELSHGHVHGAGGHHH